jgi:dienelactone hydrolase
MMQVHPFGAVFALVLCASPALGQSPVPGKNAPVVRGKGQAVYFFPGAQAAQPDSKPIVFYACGDGGWRGMAITMAETMASWGYDTFGLDSKVYLESFTGKTTLKESEVNADFRTLVEWARGQFPRPIILVGWSEGAGLALLAAAGPANRDLLQGFIAIGLPDRNILAWHWSDAVTWITKKDPDEPTFASALYLPQVAPLPILMLNSSQDEYQTRETYQQLFQLAGKPEKMVTIEARDHRFDGNRDAFFNALREGLHWIEQTAGARTARP